MHHATRARTCSDRRAHALRLNVLRMSTSPVPEDQATQSTTTKRFLRTRKSVPGSVWEPSGGLVLAKECVWHPCVCLPGEGRPGQNHVGHTSAFDLSAGAASLCIFQWALINE